MPQIENIPNILYVLNFSTGVGKKIFAKKGGFITNKLPKKAEEHANKSKTYRRSELNNDPIKSDTIGHM